MFILISAGNVNDYDTNTFDNLNICIRLCIDTIHRKNNTTL